MKEVDRPIEITDLREMPLEIVIGRYLLSKGISSLEQVEHLLEPPKYAVIPMQVLEAKNLSFAEKIIFAELNALTKKKGYCFATNHYIAERIGSTSNYVTELISSLAKKNYIRIEVFKNKEGTFRNVYTLPGEGDSTTPGQVIAPYIIEHNNKSIYNNTLNSLSQEEITQIAEYYQKQISSSARITPLVRETIQNCAQRLQISKKDLLRVIDNKASDDWFFKNCSNRGMVWFFNSKGPIRRWLAEN